MSTLNTTEIGALLSDCPDCRIHVFDSLPSTNAWLLERSAEFGTPQLCAAELQTAGRGRRGKTWQSPRAGVTFSIFRRFTVAPAQLAGLSLVTGCAVASVLETYGAAGIKLKWPNDVLWGDKKLCGMLIELNSQSGSVDTVTGIGLNYAGVGDEDRIDQPFTDLVNVIGRDIPDRNRLIGQIAAAVLQAYSQYESQGMSAFRALWEAYDAYRGKPVVLLRVSGEQIVGVARGLGESGALLLDTDNGLQEFFAGEVSVRLQQ